MFSRKRNKVQVKYIYSHTNLHKKYDKYISKNTFLNTYIISIITLVLAERVSNTR